MTDPLLSAASALIETQRELTALWRTQAQVCRAMLHAALDELHKAQSTVQRQQRKAQRQRRLQVLRVYRQARSGR